MSSDAQADVHGLSGAEAARRLTLEGPNEIDADKARPGLRIALDVLREPMLALLVAAATLYFLLGEAADAWTLGGFVGVIVAITFLQERRTERALGALRDLSSPRACVVRDGVRMRIPGRELVRGDVVFLSEGDRVPADAIVRSARNLTVDESVLTGESLPVDKEHSATAETIAPPGDGDRASVYLGTLVASGHGLVVVAATGPRTELGRIGRSISAAPVEPTRLQRETKRLVRWFAAGGLAISAVIATIHATNHGGSASAWKEGLLAGIAAAMSLLPEEFAVVLSIYLAIGAWRLSRQGVLARRMPAVEALGETTVLCTDKTGTLTQNRMTLAVLRPSTGESRAAAEQPLSTDQRELLRTSVLASRREGFDPIDRAIQELADRFPDPERRENPELVREYALSPELPAMTRAWKFAESSELEIASKGAPEAVACLCRMTPSERERLLAHAAELARGGRRVLAVARSSMRPDALPSHHAEFVLEMRGLIGFEDPLRPSVPNAIAECKKAGVRVVMVTGDHPATAQAIASRAGIDRSDAVLAGASIAGLSDDELERAVEGVGVFARVVPEQKLRIVRAFAARGDVVAMTGDGVNDGPALRAAHVGIAMGGRGTDVAREAAGLVLLDDDFSSIVGGIRMGRRIHDNIQRAMVFIVAVHVPIAALTLGQVLVPGAPLLLLPVHLAFLELVIDPTCSLVFEAEAAEPGIMDRPPRALDQPLLTFRSVGLALIQGFSALVACVIVLLFARLDHPPEVARALAFTTLIVAIVMMVLANRAGSQTTRVGTTAWNRLMWLLLVGTVTLLALVLFVPPIQAMFHFAPLRASDLALAIGAGLLSLSWYWLIPSARRREASSA